MEQTTADLSQMGFDPTCIQEALQAASGSFDGALAILLGETALSNEPDGCRVTQLEISQYTFESQGSSGCTAIALHASFGLLKNMKIGVDAHDRGTHSSEIRCDNPNGLYY
jgi:hypothetical protein